MARVWTSQMALNAFALQVSLVCLMCFLFLFFKYIITLIISPLVLYWSHGDQTLEKERKKKPETVEYECAVLFWSFMFYRQSLMCLEKRDELPHLHDNFYFFVLYCALKVLSAHWTSMSVSHIPVRMEAPAWTNRVITTADVRLHSKVMKTEGVG